MFAARENCVACLPVLADAGANLNEPDPDGITPMVNSIINGHYDVARFLLDRGADPNLGDKTGRTALTPPSTRTPCRTRTGRRRARRKTKPAALTW